MSDAWERLEQRLRELADLQRTLALMSWDRSVMMPPAGAPARARATATLRGIAHSRLTDPAIGELLAELEEDDSLEEHQRRSVELLRRDYDKAVKLPARLVRELAEASTIGYQVWTEARPAADFGMFRPHLERIVALKREAADAVGYDKERYDALLDDFEPGMTSAEVEQMFAGLGTGLAPLVDEVLGRVGERPAFLSARCEIAGQERFCRWLVEHVGFDTRAGRLDVSPHPFTMHVGPGDVRQTTRYRENELTSSVYAALHESGHALYDQGLPEQWADLPVGGAPSLGMHESQSRLWENHVGRSRGFSAFLLRRLKEQFETALGGVTPDDFYRGVNHPERSPIRVEADELTYNLHIVLRFELELALFRDELAVADLPGAWNEAMERHLGIRPRNDAEGVLQDMHWSTGMFGYFPTYSLGTMYAAAFYARAEADLGGLSADLEAGRTDRLLGWLREHVHAHGDLYDAPVLAERILGEPPGPGPLLDYLRDKYLELY